MVRDLTQLPSFLEIHFSHPSSIKFRVLIPYVFSLSKEFSESGEKKTPKQKTWRFDHSHRQGNKVVARWPDLHWHTSWESQKSVRVIFFLLLEISLKIFCKFSPLNYQWKIVKSHRWIVLLTHKLFHLLSLLLQFAIEMFLSGYWIHVLLPC